MIREHKQVVSPTRWGQERRLEFIDFRLLWEGRINRGDLTNFFQISLPQASADVAKYSELAPNNLEYDISEKVYRASPRFKPILTPNAPQNYFLHLLALHSQTSSHGTSFIGWMPPHEVIESPRRVVRAETLIAVLSAIRAKNALEIEYQSLNRPTAIRRWIAPTAVVNDEFRWHVRAWCHIRRKHVDFLFGRMLQVLAAKPQEEELPRDEDWESFITLVMRPNPELTEGQRRAAELDYAMENGQLEIVSRKALVFYLLRRLRLDEDAASSPKARQLVLVNRDEVFAAAGGSSDFVPQDSSGTASK